MEQMKWKELFMKYKVQIGVVVAVILVVAVAALAGGGSAANQESTAEEAAQGSDAETTEGRCGFSGSDCRRADG